MKEPTQLDEHSALEETSNTKDELRSQMVRRRRTPAEIWEEIRRERKSAASNNSCAHENKVPFLYGLSKIHPNCPVCSDRDRAHIREFRQMAQDYTNIYSWICLYPEDVSIQYLKDAGYLFLAISIQVVAPLIIARQLFADLDGEICKHTKSELQQFPNLGKVMSFVLSAYFGVVSINTFLGNLRGNAFLLFFSSFSMQRKNMLVLGLLAQVLGLVAANCAEYLLFVSRGTDDFLLLLFTSTTMQATLNADGYDLITAVKNRRASSIISRVLSDEALDLGNDGEASLPEHLLTKLDMFRKIYDVLALLLLAFFVLLTASVTYCI